MNPTPGRREGSTAARTLARVLGAPAIGDPQGDLGITLGYVTSNITTAYDPNNVQHADISVLPNSPTDTC